MVSRRRFIQAGVSLGVGLALPLKRPSQASAAFAHPPDPEGPVSKAYYQSSGLRKFIQPLRGVGPGGIPVAAPDGTRTWNGVEANHYSVGISQFTDQLHPDQGPTTLRGYHPANPLGGGVQEQKHLGGIIVAQRGRPVQVTFRNQLSGDHPLMIDTSLMGADMGPNRVVPHLHGGDTPWLSDGGPFAWWSPNGEHGESFINNQVLNPGAAPHEAEFYFPNQQSARMLWYHDHALGITRLNAYAGLASAFIVRDKFEGELRNFGLPNFIENGGREIPVIIQDKIFVGADIATADPTWSGVSTPGSLWYPHVYEPDRWELEPGHPAVPDVSVVPEMFGDTMLANGLVYPEATVEARRYRLRILNACQARFLNLQLYVDNGSPDGITLNPATLAPVNAKGPDYLVIGSEGGFLFKPTVVRSNRPFNLQTRGGSLVTGPAERWDVIVDFSGYAGKKIILYNDAPAPFPSGDPANDFFPGNPDNPVQPQEGFGPNTRQIMRFNVVPGTGKEPPAHLSSMALVQELPPFLVPITSLLQDGFTLSLPFITGSSSSAAAMAPQGLSAKIKTRALTLNEAFDEFGRLLQLQGTNIPVAPGQFGRAYSDPATETPRNGAVEIWQIANLTMDSHPIHFHLVNVQILSRQPFNMNVYNGTPTYTGQARLPEATELGWKETVKMHPGEVTTVIMKFDLPRAPFSVPPSPRTGGNEYVWHCHILDHEEHDMMRPLIVT